MKKRPRLAKKLASVRKKPPEEQRAALEKLRALPRDPELSQKLRPSD